MIGFKPTFLSTAVAAILASAGLANAASVEIWSVPDFSISAPSGEDTFVIDTSGFENIMLSFTLEGRGSLDAGGDFQDTFSASWNPVGDDPISLVSIAGAIGETTYTESLSGADGNMIALSFSAFLTGSDEFYDVSNLALTGDALETIAPVPLPASALLLLAGLGGFATLRRFKG